MYRLETQSVMLVLSTHLYKLLPSNLLSGHLSPLPCVNKYTLYTYTVCKGEGYGVMGLRQINTCRKVPLQFNFFRWGHFALPSMSLIFLRFLGETWIMLFLNCNIITIRHFLIWNTRLNQSQPIMASLINMVICKTMTNKFRNIDFNSIWTARMPYKY